MTTDSNSSRPNADPVKMFICPDTDDPFAPMPPNMWLYPVAKYADNFEQLMQTIPEVYHNSFISLSFFFFFFFLNLISCYVIC